MNWQNKKVLVTGAGGFIGSHLTEALVEAGATVKGFVHYNALGSWGWLDHSRHKQAIEVVAGDICDRDSVRQAMQGIDIVFHLAALIAIPYSYDAPQSYVRTNIEGTLNVLQIARELGVERVVHTSTSEVYGTAQYVPIDESHPLQGQSPYSASKIGADKIAESFYLSFDVPVVTVRPFNTFGPRQSARAIIPTIITQCLTRSEIVLGNVQPTRDFNYVTNTVEGFMLAASNPDVLGKTINLGSGYEISVGELIEKIVSLVNKPIEVKHDKERFRPVKSEVDRLLADNTLAKRYLNWRPAVTFVDGLQKTIGWFAENLDRYRAERYVL